jgi:hypothetical protein
MYVGVDFFFFSAPRLGFDFKPDPRGSGKPREAIQGYSLFKSQKPRANSQFLICSMLSSVLNMLSAAHRPPAAVGSATPLLYHQLRDFAGSIPDPLAQQFPIRTELSRRWWHSQQKLVSCHTTVVAKAGYPGGYLPVKLGPTTC